MMPGPTSDSFDPDFGTAERADEFREHLGRLYARVAELIGSPPVDFRTLPDREAGELLTHTFSERDWRFIRYALESAQEGV